MGHLWVAGDAEGLLLRYHQSTPDWCFNELLHSEVPKMTMT